MAEGTDSPRDGGEDETANGPNDDTGSDEGGTEELPPAVIDEVERLTRRAREAVDPNEAAAYRERRASTLADHGFRARVREEGRATLVLYPAEWVEDGTVQPDRIENVGRGIERPLEGPGEADEWTVVEEHNRDLAEAVAAAHGDVHGANAHALADYASNHYAKPIGDLTGQELAEFLDEYFPRNAWPSDDQKAAVEESVRLVFAETDQPLPIEI
jgi:hypothetical protein